MDKVQYLNKMQDFKNYTSTFKLLGPVCIFKYIQKTEKNIIDLLKSLVKNNELTQEIDTYRFYYTKAVWSPQTA